jgi:hypothetical protein
MTIINSMTDTTATSDHIEHRVDNLDTVLTGHYLTGAKENRDMLNRLDERVSQLEAAA